MTTHLYCSECKKTTEHTVTPHEIFTDAAIKYLWRWKAENGTEDLRKARWYTNKMLGEQQ